MLIIPCNFSVFYLFIWKSLSRVKICKQSNFYRFLTFSLHIFIIKISILITFLKFSAAKEQSLS